MKTTIKGIEIKKAIALVKPFVGSLRGKKASRPILKTALINEKYIIATDAHRLIRITHNEKVQEPYLHHFKEELTRECVVTSYPNTDRLIPEQHNAQHSFQVNVVEWLEAHELGLVAAKEYKNRVISLENGEFKVNAVETIVNKQGKTVKNTDFNKIAYKYFMGECTIEKVAYNCEYMLDMLKIFKKLKLKEVTCYFYGPMRPMYFVSQCVEALILPVRTY